MPKETTHLEVMAVVARQDYDWKVLVSLDRATFEALARRSQVNTPQVGTKLPVSEPLERLRNLENREAKVAKFAELLREITAWDKEEEEAE